ncbi:hypothetical protein DFP91_3723 [Pseudorhodoplanes sinuspersici]|nr:hypothetical protein DFP91_3723 [Pseudorhodoplanes sinuspersici]
MERLHPHLPDDNARLWSHPLQQSEKIVPAQRNASSRRFETVARDVNENGAAAAGDARAIVVIDFYNQVVKIIGPHQAVTGLVRLSMHGAVIASVGRVFAPGIGGTDSSDW